MSGWEAFFDGQAQTYEQNGFTQHTRAEIDFFLTLFALRSGARILDMGCGTGRHSIELARRAYEVTGVDLSERMLEVARSNAAVQGVSVEWVRCDGTQYRTPQLFDAAICLCEGGVGIVNAGENVEQHDLAIFRSIAQALKPGAPFLLTALNGYSVIRQMSDEQIAAGRFNPATMYSTYSDLWDLPEGTRQMEIYERLFIPPEEQKLLEQAGFLVDNVFGGTAGHWARRSLSLDEVEAMYVCRKG